MGRGHMGILTTIIMGVTGALIIMAEVAMAIITVIQGVDTKADYQKACPYD